MNSELKVFIVTEGGDRIGFGHITRCLSLYQAFEASGVLPEFVVYGDASIDDVLKNMRYKRLNWHEHKERILSSINGSDIAIIDSYLADLNFYREVSDSARVPVYIDDNKRVDYPKGVVVNGSISAELLHYPSREHIAYLLGPEYIPQRKEFWNVPDKEIREKVESIMITFGGDDPRNITPAVLRLLVTRYPLIAKNVIIGRGYRNADEIKTAADGRTELIYFPGAEGMKSVMLESDLAISAGGQTLYELARVGVPAVVVAVADNQFNHARGWQRTGFIEYAGWWEDGMLLDNVDGALKQLEDSDRRKKMSQTGSALVDGKGAKRIVDYLVGMNKR
ncbi:MAG: PseG/SpsG family protein [Dissulfurispiraceae bacterium]